MKSYSVDIQVDFAAPRDMALLTPGGRPWRAPGYFQYFYCTERSTERAKELALGFVRQNEEFVGECRFKCVRVAWMRTLKEREEIAFGDAAGLTEAMFAGRNQIGVWFHTERLHYVSEIDAALDLEEHGRLERRP